jgi:hypothetical protein
MRHPPADIVGQADVAVMAARTGGQVDGLPIAVVRADVGPVRVIADMESPAAVEQGRRGAQRRRVTPASARQGTDAATADASSVARMIQTNSLRRVAAMASVIAQACYERKRISSSDALRSPFRCVAILRLPQVRRIVLIWRHACRWRKREARELEARPGAAARNAPRVRQEQPRFCGLALRTRRTGSVSSFGQACEQCARSSAT